VPNISQLLVLLALGVTTPSHADPQSETAPPQAGAARVERHPPRWDLDPQLRSSFLSGLTREIARVPLGAPWPDAVPDRSDCVSYIGDYDNLSPITYWVYACHSRREAATRTEYTYILEGSVTPTLERVRYVLVAPPDARVEDWGKAQETFLEDLSAALEIPKWRNRDWQKIGVGRDRVVEEELFTALPDTGKATAASRFTLLSFPMADSTGGLGYNRKRGSVRAEMRPIGGNEAPKITQPPQPPRRTRATVESLVVYCFSRRLEAETHEASWDLERGDTTVAEDSVGGFPSPIEYGRSEAVGALRPRWPELAAVLESTRTTSDQIRVVDSAVSAARQEPAGPEPDLILYAAHLWTNAALGDLQGNPPLDCNVGDNAFVREFNAVFSSRDRSQIGCDHYGTWWYSGGFIDSVVTRAGADRWADYAFLDRTSVGWSVEYDCSSDVGTDEFRPVIARGEAFLKAHPSSLVAPEVRLLVAEAHETAWSLGKIFPGDQYVDSTVYARDAPTHRSRAIELYGLQLRERPEDPRNAGIRKRLARMRLDVDTGYREFWCEND